MQNKKRCMTLVFGETTISMILVDGQTITALATLLSGTSLKMEQVQHQMAVVQLKQNY